jgi:hypothetical protein
MNKEYIALIFSCILFSCISDYSEELSGNYFYLKQGRNRQVILSHQLGKMGIHGKVVSYNFNKDFILALQQPSFEDYRYIISNDLKGDTNNTAVDVNASQNMADSILKHDPYYRKIFSQEFNYWIISHSENKTYGPLTVEEYLRMREQLHIPAELRIR